MERMSPESVMRALPAYDILPTIEEARFLIDFNENFR
jgi:hypothetical protein